MATEAQILANRLNAQKSTGPLTPQGKEIISQNAVKHGLTAANDIISSESQTEFELYRDRMLDELAPQSPVESLLAERVVSLSWRLKRTGRIQNQAIDAMNKDSILSPLAKLTRSLLPKSLQPSYSDPSDDDAALALGRLAIKDFSNERVLERLLMYERRIENSLYKTILELQRLNLVKKLNPVSEIPDSFRASVSPAITMAGSSFPVNVHRESIPATRLTSVVWTKDGGQGSLSLPQAKPEVLSKAEASSIQYRLSRRSPKGEDGSIEHPVSSIQHRASSLQNKPNFKNDKMNVSPSITKEYENLCPCEHFENKPNFKHKPLAKIGQHQSAQLKPEPKKYKIAHYGKISAE